MLNNSPLRELLSKHVDWRGIRTSIERGHLRALALCATSYVTGQSVAFYDATENVRDWARFQRIGPALDADAGSSDGERRDSAAVPADAAG